MVYFQVSKHFSDSPKPVYQSLESTRYLSNHLFNVVDPMIEQNGFFVHPEHLLLVITQDDRKNIREFGIQGIQKARLIDARRKTVRLFTSPKTNFSVEEYSEIIIWMHCELPSLPLLAEISNNEIKLHIDSDTIPDWIITFKQIPVYMRLFNAR